MIRLAFDALAAIGWAAVRLLPASAPITINLHLGPVHHHAAQPPPLPAPEPLAAADTGDEDQVVDEPMGIGLVDDPAPTPIQPGPQHIDGEGCPCRPTTVPVERDDGSIRFVYAHQIDPYADPENQAARAVSIFEGMATVRAEIED